jgi:methyl coenzyme M reductase subunit C-like uncharacterized protein (methanogenesis marker protein 7)
LRIGICPICGESYATKSASKETCGEKSCASEQKKRKKKNPQLASIAKYEGNDQFTDTTREIIVDLIEHRQQSVKQMARILHRSEIAIQAQIDDLKASGEYDRIWQRLKSQRATNAEMNQMSSLRRYYSTGDTKNNIKIRNNI